MREWVRGDELRHGAFEALLAHVDAAYERGRIAGKSQAGYTTRRRPREVQCPTSTSAPDATGFDASADEPCI